MSDIHSILKSYWGYDSFRPMQEDIIRAVLEEKDTLAIMPTGGGKSLCYQVPALMKDGICLVISPLIALMKDQVENLSRKNITAFAIYSGMSRKEVINVLKLSINSNCKFLYVSPERLETALFKEYLPGMDISLIAVDEAHCISQWGYDFRPPYLRIAALREELPKVPVLALTASATPEIQKDICEKLLFSKPAIFHQSFERPNLSYSVFSPGSKINKVTEILGNVPGSAIVYCKSRRKTKEISELLNMQGIVADYYHAGLAQEERNKKQESWVSNNTRVIVCTNAFGMGIDKPDVRTVIHIDVPDCLENYYQEAGRAGRDGKRSYAVLLYEGKNIDDLKNSVSIRYPSLDEIKNIYQSISNYLQIPAGNNEGDYFDFDLTDFAKKFRYDSRLVFYALKTLEQEGWLSFNEQVFVPPTVEFIADKNYLYQFEKDHPKEEQLIKLLLRTYEGIFDFPAVISETLLARSMKTEKETIVKDLEQLHRYAIISYQPQKTTPQIGLLRGRIRAEDLRVNTAIVEKRKEKYLQRTNAMIAYVHEKNNCRSSFIASYFGDDEVRPCGICDNCIAKKSKTFTKEEFEAINQLIVSSVKGRSIHAKELIQQLPGIKKEKAWEVIHFLESENKIQVDSNGLIKLK